MTTINLRYSSEMMKNYLQAELISPQEKFEALQTSDGHSLLFSIGTDGVFYLIREESGKSATGWSKIDLSSSQIRQDFPGESGVSCRTFEADQIIISRVDRRISPPAPHRTVLADFPHIMCYNT